MDSSRIQKLEHQFSESTIEEPSFKNEITVILEAAKSTTEKERQMPVVPLKFVPPKDTIEEMRIGRTIATQNERGMRDSSKDPYIQYVEQRIEYSIRPLKELRPTTLQSMQARERKKDHYLLCRIISPAFRFVALTFAIEDTEGWSQIVALYNFPGTLNATTTELDTIFPKNSVIAIREPLAKMEPDVSYSHIRIDSPSDIVFVDSGDQVLKRISWATGETTPFKRTRSVAQWKATGDQHFKEKQFFAAIMAYTYALQQDRSQITIRLNRCLAYIRWEMFARALNDATVVLESKELTKHDRIKALYRAAQSEYGEGHYVGARQWYQKCLEVDPDLGDAKAGSLRCEARMREQKGIYDWKELFEGSLHPGFKPDIADFRGPVAVTDLSHRGGGRGLTATRDVDVGELLIVAKPFSAAFLEESKGPRGRWALNVDTNTFKLETSFITFQKTMEKIAMNPVQYFELLDLYAGDCFPPISKTAPPSPRNWPDNPLEFSHNIDSARFYDILSLNSFNFEPVNKLASFKDDEEEAKAKPTGFYLLPSYINHSCIPNAGRENFGDAMVIRAVQKIRKREEIYLSYPGIGAPYSHREDSLTKWAIDCGCEVCRFDREVGVEKTKKRELLHDQALDSLSASQIRQLVQQIDETYLEKHPFYRPESARVHDYLARVLMQNRQPSPTIIKEAIQEAMIALDKMGIQVINKKMTEAQPRKDSGKRLPISIHRVPYVTLDVVKTCLLIAHFFSILNTVWRSEGWLRAAVWIEDTKMGGGLPLFKLRYAAYLEGFSLTPLLEILDMNP
ncbi:hypothetical protein CPB86DRAFT_821844 [Serendipita vermifera]|nr:hypothetical protein CPB86DRAFT_821844 [Serendipita vermifera]